MIKLLQSKFEPGRPWSCHHVHRSIQLLSALAGGIAADAAAQSSPLIVQIHSPTNGAVIATSRGIGVSALAHGPHQVARVEFYDGAKLIATDTNAPYNFSWRASAKENGEHIWTARAYDQLGQGATSAPVRIRLEVDPNAPVAAPSISQPPAAPRAVRVVH